MWIHGADGVAEARRVALFDAKMTELGLTGLLSPQLKQRRQDLSIGKDSVADGEESRLNGKTIPELRDEARDLGVSLRGKTRKQDIVDVLLAARVQGKDARLDKELQAFFSVLLAEKRQADTHTRAP